MSLNIEVVAPECSVSLKYWQKWTGVEVIPVITGSLLVPCLYQARYLAVHPAVVEFTAPGRRPYGASDALTPTCEELRQTAEAKFFAQLALFGHSKHDDADDYGEGLLEAMMGRALPLLQDTANFAGRLCAVVLQIVRQLQALASPKAGFAAGFRDVRLRPVSLALGDALAVLQTLDAIVTGNRVVAAAWE